MPVILAHCITDNVPIGQREDWNGAVLPLGSDWVRHLYSYMDVYVKKVRAALIQIGEWDRSVTVTITTTTTTTTTTITATTTTTTTATAMTTTYYYDYDDYY